MQYITLSRLIPEIDSKNLTSYSRTLPENVPNCFQLVALVIMI